MRYQYYMLTKVKMHCLSYIFTEKHLTGWLFPEKKIAKITKNHSQHFD